jgi:hypothetical protein
VRVRLRLQYTGRVFHSAEVISMAPSPGKFVSGGSLVARVTFSASPSAGGRWLVLPANKV